MSTGDSAMRWARSVAPAEVASWGDCEAQVLGRPAPPQVGESAGGQGLIVFGWVIAALIIAPLAGSSLITFALIAIGGDPMAVWLFATISAGVGPCIILLWLEERPRRPIYLALAVGTTIVCSASIFMARASEDYSENATVTFVLLGAIVLNLVAFVVVAFLSVPQRKAGRASLPRFMSISKERRYSQARTEVLDTLIGRGVIAVDHVEYDRIVDMPLGAWHELDSQGRLGPRWTGSLKAI